MNPNAKPFVFNSNAPVWSPHGMTAAPQQPEETQVLPPDPPEEAAAEDEDEIDEEVMSSCISRPSLTAPGPSLAGVSADRRGR